MQRVLLVKPDANFALDLAPPVGLGYLGASIRKAGHEVRCLDNRLPHEDEVQLWKTIAEWKPSVVGLSAFSYDVEAVRRVATQLKERYPGTLVIAGGPLASSDPGGALCGGVVDVAIQGEGEQITVDLLNRIEAGEDWHDLEAIAYWDQDKGEPVVNAIESFIKDLDALPAPEWDLLDVRAYAFLPRQGFIYKHRSYFPVFTSRGCPYRCIYCHDVFGKRFRPRSAETVLNEIGELVEELRLPGDPLHR